MPYCRERGLAKSHYCQKGVSPTMAISDFSQIVATRISPNHRTTSAEAAQQRRFLVAPAPSHSLGTKPRLLEGSRAPLIPPSPCCSFTLAPPCPVPAGCAVSVQKPDGSFPWRSPRGEVAALGAPLPGEQTGGPAVLEPSCACQPSACIPNLPG